MKQIILIITISLLVFSLSACGKKGELKPPASYEKNN